MSQPAHAAASKTASTTGPAVLVIDGEGRVQAASAGACQLWQARNQELSGDHFPNLFVFEVTSKDADWVQSQWEVLLAAAQPGSITLKLQPKEAAAFDAEVRLEKVMDDPACYFAHIARPAAAAAPAATPPPVGSSGPPLPLRADQPSLLELLHARGPVGFFDLNFVSNEVNYSPAWKKMLGYADADLPNTYDSWLKLLHPDDTAAAPDRKARGAAPGSRPFAMEFRMKHALGHWVWVQSAGVQVYGPNGALQRVVGVHLDAQERKESEEAGLRAEERLHSLGDDARLGLFDLDFAASQFWYSPAFHNLLGIAKADAADPSADLFLKSLPAGEAPEGLAAWFLARHPEEPAFTAPLTLVRHRDNLPINVQAGIVRILGRKKDLQRVTGYIAPLPDGAAPTPASSGRAGLPLEHLAVLLDEMHEGALVVDANGQVLFLNPRAVKLLGLTAEQCVGQHVGEIFRLIHRLSAQPGESPIDRVLTTGEPVPLNDEFALDFGGSRVCPVTYSCQPVGQAGAVLVFRNPDEMSLTPEELIAANRFDALGKLAGGIAHDFNNLLTTILGGVSLAKDNRDSSGLENSERACLAAKGLSKQLLTFSKGGTAVRQTIKTADILTDAVRLAASGSVVKIESKIAPDISPVTVDRAQILQVFQNLIINAIQAMATGQGNIWINAANVTLAENQITPLDAGAYVAVEVRDNGSGIKPEHLEKIFSPFFTTKKTGTGLGLATVVSIVKRHGGQLTVESEVGAGTAFTVFLPAAQEEAAVEPRRAPTLNVATSTRRLLFMDDDPQICALTRTMIEAMDYRCDVAKHGEEAIQLYKRYLNIGRPYDAVIMDLTIIGGMGGEQTFKLLREMDPNVRAIIASGYDNDEMARQFMDMGFLGYLTKPYRAADLAKVIKGVLGG